MSTMQNAWAATSGTIAERQAQLRALTRSVERTVQWREVRARALVRGEWARIAVRARQTPSMTADGAPATPTDAAILAAINAAAMLDDQEITPDEWPSLSQGIAVLAAVKDISADLASEIAALATREVPVFTDAEIDFPALHTAGLISDVEAGLAPAPQE